MYLQEFANASSHDLRLAAIISFLGFVVDVLKQGRVERAESAWISWMPLGSRPGPRVAEHLFPRVNEVELWKLLERVGIERQFV